MKAKRIQHSPRETVHLDGQQCALIVIHFDYRVALCAFFHECSILEGASQEQVQCLAKSLFNQQLMTRLYGQQLTEINESKKKKIKIHLSR